MTKLSNLLLVSGFKELRRKRGRVCTYTQPWQRWRWWRRRGVEQHVEAAKCLHTPAEQCGLAWWSAGWMSGGSWPAVWLAPRCGWTVTFPVPPGVSCDHEGLTPGQTGRTDLILRRCKTTWKISSLCWSAAVDFFTAFHSNTFLKKEPAGRDLQSQL